MNVLNDNVITSNILKFLGPWNERPVYQRGKNSKNNSDEKYAMNILSLMSLRLTNKWLSKKVVKQLMPPFLLSCILIDDDKVNLFEQCIHKDSTFFYNQKYVNDRGKFIEGLEGTIIQHDCIQGFKFYTTRFISKEAWTMRWHIGNRTMSLYRMAVPCSSYKIMTYLIQSIMNDIEKKVELFWFIVYHGDVNAIQWFLNSNILPRYFLKSCPVHNGVKNSEGYLSEYTGIAIDVVRENMRYLKNNFIFNDSVFENLMMNFVTNSVRRDITKEIAHIHGHVSEKLCQTISRKRDRRELYDTIHSDLYSVCGHKRKK